MIKSNNVSSNGLADVVGLPHFPLNATRTLRMIENLIRVLIYILIRRVSLSRASLNRSILMSVNFLYITLYR